MAQSHQHVCEGSSEITGTTGQQINEFVDNMTSTTHERLSLDGQLRQALISLERYIDEDEQILTENEITIPKLALSKAKGIVFLSLIKCGFVVAGCIGTGCILVRDTTTNKWSGPSSIACAGLSVGLLAGASKVDYILILPNKMAVKSFMSSGQLRIGGDLSVTVGPVGREAYSNIGKGDIGPTSFVYSYSHSKGLYGGISLHGIALSVRNECNEQFYGEPVSNQEILSGKIKVPQRSNDFYHRIVYILTAYCHEPRSSNDSTHSIHHRIKSIDGHKKHNHQTHGIAACSCKLCQGHRIGSRSNVNGKWDKTNPFFNDHTETTVHPVRPKGDPKGVPNKPRKQNKTQRVTVNRVERIQKVRATKAKTKILKEKFLESTPTPPPPDDGLYRYDDEKVQIIGDNVTLKVDDPWSTPKGTKRMDRNQDEDEKQEEFVEDPYALNVRPWDKLIDPAQYRTKEDDGKFEEIICSVKERESGDTFRIDSDDEQHCESVKVQKVNDDDGKTKEKALEAVSRSDSATTDDQKVENEQKPEKSAKSKESEQSQQSEKAQKFRESAKSEKSEPSKTQQSTQSNSVHYSDYNVTKYSLENYDKDGYRINTFSLLFQIGDSSYETSIEIAGKLVSKQYIVNWPRKHDCKCVIIVTSKTYSSYFVAQSGDESEGHDYELRLICYDPRDDDLIVYDIDIALPHIKQLVNAINGAFTLSPGRPWIVLEAIFSGYNKKMYESMIDISTTFHQRGSLQYGDLVRINFGSLCQYGLYIGENGNHRGDEYEDEGMDMDHYGDRAEIICFRRRFPNNGSSAFKKYRLMNMVLSGKASKRITMRYCTLNEYIADCSRIEVVYYPLPCISAMALVKKAIVATSRSVRNCNVEYSAKIEARLSLTPLESIEESVLTVLDGITGTVNSIAQAVSPTI